jgi:flagellar biosynthesis protein FlhB
MSEKTEKPTARKLRDARKKGEVPKSKEVTQVGIFISVLALFSILSGFHHYEISSTLRAFSGWASSARRRS